MNELTLSDGFTANEKGLHLHHNSLEVSDSAFLMFTQLQSNESVTLTNHFKPEMRQAALHFIVNGQTNFTQNNRTAPADFGGDKINLMLIQPHETIQRMSAKGEFLMASFYIDLQHFITLLDAAIDTLPVKFQKAIWKNVCSCNNYKWSPAVYRIISQIAIAIREKTATPLFMETKMLELLTILPEAEICDYYAQISVSKSDLEKIIAAHDYLLADLSNTPSLQRLARKVGTNEFVLKKGFREYYGKPVYQYAVQRKMEKALQYLTTTHQQVSDIGMLVGYEDASAFTRTFKKVFNQLPTDVRRGF